MQEAQGADRNEKKRVGVPSPTRDNNLSALGQISC
jgi:hypothetical protein